METSDWVVVIVFGSLGFVIVSWLIDKYPVKTAGAKQEESSWRSSQENNASSHHSDNVSSRQKSKSLRWYEILEVDASASLSEVKMAYRKKIQQYHPDRLEGMAPELYELALEKAKVINAAYTEAVRLKS